MIKVYNEDINYNCYLCDECGGTFMEPIDGRSPCCYADYTKHVKVVNNSNNNKPFLNGQKSMSPSSRKKGNKVIYDSDQYYVLVSKFNKGYYVGMKDRVPFYGDLDDAYLYLKSSAYSLFNNRSSFFKDNLVVHRVEVKNNVIIKDLDK